MQGGGVGAGDAVEAVHGEDAAAAEVGEDLGDVDEGVVYEVFGEAFEVGAFDGEVELAEEGFAELADDGDGLVGAEDGGVTLHEFGEELDDFEIGFDLAGDTGAEDFDDDAGAAGEGGAVDLGDGGGGEGLGFEGSEKGFEVATEIFFDGGAGDFGAVGGDVGLEFGEFVGEIGAEEVGAGAEHLAQFDEGGAEFGERHADALRGSEGAQGLAIGTAEFVGDPGEFEVAEEV